MHLLYPGICFISHSSGRGGSEKAFPKLIQGWKAGGFRVIVILPSNGPIVEDLRKRRIDFVVCRFKWWMSAKQTRWRRAIRLAWNLVSALWLAGKIRKLRLDIVYTNTITTPVGALAAMISGKPHVWHIREFGFEDHGLYFDLGKRTSFWIINHLSTVCLVNSRAVANSIRPYIPDSKLKLIYEGYDSPGVNSCVVPLGSVDDAPADITCIIVGGIHERKGQADAVKAIIHLHSAGIKARLHIVGEGNPTYRDYLTALVRGAHLEEYINFTGFLEDPISAMRQCDLVLMCSKREAFGIVTLEAMYVGKPVIGTGTGGTPELIHEGFNGLLYEPGNHKELADKIKFLLENPEISRSMGEKGKQWALENFSEAKYVSQTLEILRALKKN